jgi:hypothetical protein
LEKNLKQRRGERDKEQKKLETLIDEINVAMEEEVKALEEISEKAKEIEKR